MKKDIKDYICLALDGTPENAIETIGKIRDKVGYYKVGIIQFYTDKGWEIVRRIKDIGANVFLDLKLHDIPNTASEAACNLIKPLDINDIINIHAQGGYKMMSAVVDSADEIKPSGRPFIIAVTLLTSFDKLSASIDLRTHDDPDTLVTHYTWNAYRAGCDGVVCSANDITTIKSYGNLGTDFLYVTPGIRLAGDVAHDQKRITTPEKAVREGSKLMVIGRAISQASDPDKRIEEIKSQIERGLTL